MQLANNDDIRMEIRQHSPCERSEFAERVLAFMQGAGQPILEKPGDPGPAVRKLAAELLLEEAVETIEALGFRVAQGNKGKLYLIQLNAPTAFKLHETADGYVDTMYVCHWGMNAIGVADMLPTLEVCDANDRKLGPGHSFNESGKLMKPVGWVPPDIEGAIEAQSKWSEEE